MSAAAARRRSAAARLFSLRRNWREQHAEEEQRPWRCRGPLPATAPSARQGDADRARTAVGSHRHAHGAAARVVSSAGSRCNFQPCPASSPTAAAATARPPLARDVRGAPSMEECLHNPSSAEGTPARYHPTTLSTTHPPSRIAAIRPRCYYHVPTTYLPSYIAGKFTVNTLPIPSALSTVINPPASITN